MLLAFFFSRKIFSFIIFIDVGSPLSRQIMNKYDTDVSLYQTPATMLMSAMSPSGERTIAFEFFFFL